MKRLLTFICLALLAGSTAMAELTAGTEYYIWLNIYEKLLGSNEAGSGPALSAYGTKNDGYVFVAENSGKAAMCCYAKRAAASIWPPAALTIGV